MPDYVPKLLRDGVDYIVDGDLIRAEIYRNDPDTGRRIIVEEYFLTLAVIEACLYGPNGKVAAAQKLRDKLANQENVVPLEGKARK